MAQWYKNWMGMKCTLLLHQLELFRCHCPIIVLKMWLTMHFAADVQVYWWLFYMKLKEMIKLKRLRLIAFVVVSSDITTPGTTGSRDGKRGWPCKQ